MLIFKPIVYRDPKFFIEQFCNFVASIRQFEDFELLRELHPFEGHLSPWALHNVFVSNQHMNSAWVNCHKRSEFQEKLHWKIDLRLYGGFNMFIFMIDLTMQSFARELSDTSKRPDIPDECAIILEDASSRIRECLTRDHFYPRVVAGIAGNTQLRLIQLILVSVVSDLLVPFLHYSMLSWASTLGFSIFNEPFEPDRKEWDARKRKLDEEFKGRINLLKFVVDLRAESVETRIWRYLQADQQVHEHKQ